MGSSREGDVVVVARPGRRSEPAKENPEEKTRGRFFEASEDKSAFTKAIQVNQLLSLSLAANLVFAQTAVVRDSWFGIDKIKHFFISAFIESLSYSALQAANVKHRPALGAAIGVSAAVGVAREVHDKRTPGKWFSYRDLAWDALGISAGAIMLNHTVK